MTVVLTKEEAAIVQDCLGDRIDDMERYLECLTEPDERYERNDLLQEIQQARRLKGLFNGN